MAQIIIGGCTSHSPLLVMTPEEWFLRSSADMRNPSLNLSDGRFVSYEKLLEERGPRYADIATLEVFNQLWTVTQAALTRISEDMHSAKPDVVVLVSDDHNELFTASNQPALSIFHGEQLKTSDSFAHGTSPGQQAMAK